MALNPADIADFTGMILPIARAGLHLLEAPPRGDDETRLRQAPPPDVGFALHSRSCRFHGAGGRVQGLLENLDGFTTTRAET